MRCLSKRFGFTVKRSGPVERKTDFGLATPTTPRTAKTDVPTPITPETPEAEVTHTGVSGVRGVEGDRASCAHAVSVVTTSTSAPTVTIENVNYAIHEWDGCELAGPLIAIDTETTLIDGHEVPELALASVHAGGAVFLIFPDDVPDFLHAHRHCEFVCHNVAFDFHVLHKHCVKLGRADVAHSLWQAADENRLHDTMLLDGLVRLARTGEFPVRRDLGRVARAWAGVTELDKEDPYRLRYGEIIGKKWQDIEPGFLTYAAKDVIATLLVYESLRREAETLVEQIARGLLLPRAKERFGLLTEAAQVKAAIALHQIERVGFAVDHVKLEDLRSQTAAEQERLIGKLRAMPICQGLFKTDRNGQPILTQSGLPSHYQNRLQEILLAILGEVQEQEPRAVVGFNRTADGLLSTKEVDWAPFAHKNSFVHAWFELKRIAKFSGFLSLPVGERVHSHYTTLVSTGRTSCSKTNIQQLPRMAGLRECFVAPPGHVLLVADYKFIELVTLAAICTTRYGFSKLGEVIKAGIDPHCYTASLINGMPLQDFLELKVSNPARFKADRQKAKAVGFGIPGGMGAGALVEYAHSTYGVAMSEAEAEELRQKLTQEIYPEIGRHLNDRGMDVLARNLRCQADELWWKFDFAGTRPGWLPHTIKRVVSGNPCKRDGGLYSPEFTHRIWEGLSDLCRNPDFTGRLCCREAGEALASALFRDAAVTLTGRVWSGVGYTQWCNSQFQGLAADGAKLALFELVRKGLRVVAFVHDEIVVEVEDAGAADAKATLERVMIDEMKRVLGTDIPVGVECCIAEQWQKP